MASEETVKPLKRMPQGAIRLQFAGDIILARNSDPALAGLFRRYEALFETFANLDKRQRILAYKILNALMLTSYAKKAGTVAEKQALFAKKNQLFVGLASDLELRRYLSLRYLVSNNFRVTTYCDDCSAKNAASQRKRHEWKHCKNCQIDRDFYNVITLTYKFPDGAACIFLSNDQIHRIPFHRSKHNTAKLGDNKEEATYGKYHYNARNLDAIAHDSVLAMFERFVNK